MLSNIVPELGAESTSSGLPMDTAPLAFALERMPSELFAPALPGEDLVALRTRRAAAADILDDLLAEYAEAVAS